jgi:hypothetical protein
MPSPRGRISDRICSDSCVIQAPLDVAGGSIYDNALTMGMGCIGAHDGDATRRSVLDWPSCSNGRAGAVPIVDCSSNMPTSWKLTTLSLFCHFGSALPCKPGPARVMLLLLTFGGKPREPLYARVAEPGQPRLTEEGSYDFSMNQVH